MSLHDFWRAPGCAIVLAILPVTLWADDENLPRLGAPVTAEEIAVVDLSIERDGAGLPPGQGSAAEGATTYALRCAYCHSVDGQAQGLPLVGGGGSLTSDAPIKTVGSYWPYATSLFDYTRRSMPYDAPQSLSDDEVYAVVAYMLALNGVIDHQTTVTRDSLPEIVMPNRQGFRSWHQID